MEFSNIFNVNLRLIRLICYLSNRRWHCIQTWWDKLQHATDRFSGIKILHGPNSLSLLLSGVTSHLETFRDQAFIFSLPRTCVSVSWPTLSYLQSQLIICIKMDPALFSFFSKYSEAVRREFCPHVGL